MFFQLCLICFVKQFLKLFGSFRIESSFPWFSTATRVNRISIEEATEALTHVRYGDIGISRRDWYLSNWLIPGAMKHIWLHIHDQTSPKGRTGGVICESTSTGVHHRHALYPYRADYAMILRPRGVDIEQLRGACIRADHIKYAIYGYPLSLDPDLHARYGERERFRKGDLENGIRELEAHSKAFVRWERGFTPAEAIAYCWWHCRRTLRINRKTFNGRQALTPQDFLEFNFDIVWVSQSLTLAKARDLKFSLTAMRKLEAYYEGLKNDSISTGNRPDRFRRIR